MVLMIKAVGMPRYRKAEGKPTIPPPTHVLMMANIPENKVKPSSEASIEKRLLNLVFRMLVKFLENLFGSSMNAASSTSFVFSSYSSARASFNV